MSADALNPEPTKRSLLRRIAAWWMRPRIVFPGIVLILIITAPLTYRGYCISRVPWIDEPFDTQALQNLKIPDEDNALADYRQAAAAFVELDISAIGRWTDEWAAITKTPSTNGNIVELCLLIQKHGWNERPAAIDKWLDDNRVALEHWKRGTAKPDYQYFAWGTFDTEETDPFSGKSTSAASGDMSCLAALSCLQAMRLQAKGEPEAAWNLLVVNLRASHHVSRHGHHGDAHRAEEILQLTQPSVAHWAQQSNVDTNLLRKALRDLATEESRRPNVALAALRVDYGRLAQLLQTVGSPKSHSTEEPTAGFRLFVRGEPQVSSRTLRHIFASILPEAAKKRPDRPPTDYPYFLYEPTASHPVAHGTVDEMNLFIAHSAVFLFSNTVFSEYLDYSDQIDTRHQLLCVMLSLELFKRVHGAYPEELEQLKAVNPSIELTDLFGVSPVHREFKQLQYHYYPPEPRLRVYSVGVDGANNGGEMINTSDDIGFSLGKWPK